MSRSPLPRQAFLPTTRADMDARGWEVCDFVLVTGDAYVDHPSFANGVVGRVLEAEGFRVGVLAQPDWHQPSSVAALGEPRLAFLVSAGNLDSLLNAYTAQKLPRSDDPYSPGGRTGCRPPRATIVYCNLIRRTFGKVPIIIGGIEASQRRLSHYDYWEDRVRRSILLDANADLLVYGMGEQQLVEIGRRLRDGEFVKQLTDIRGTAYAQRDLSLLYSSAYCARFGEPVEVLAHEALLPPSGQAPQRVQERAWQTDEIAPYRKAYAVAFQSIQEQQDPVRGRPLIQRCGHLAVVQMPPPALQDAAALDRWYDLPFTRHCHPDYDEEGGVPAWQTTAFSIVSHRGCVATCSFCAITMHQGRAIQSRSLASILREAHLITRMPSFTGTISDVGGPSANMYGQHCKVQWQRGSCEQRDCLLPSLCPKLGQDVDGQIAMLTAVRDVAGVKKVFVASGVRHDLLLDGKAAGRRYIENLAAHHTGGHLKVAPEHRNQKVLAAMNKPSYALFERFENEFVAASRRAGKEQYLVSYYLSSHPGCTMDDQIAIAQQLKKEHCQPEQVQDFIPTPMTTATAMYYSGHDPSTMEPIYTATTMRDKGRQRALLQVHLPELVGRARQALLSAGRSDLIGTGGDALVPPAGRQNRRSQRGRPTKPGPRSSKQRKPRKR